MTENRLKYLLQQADRQATPPPMPEDFARRIAARAARTRRRKHFVAAAAVVLLGLLVTRIFYPPPKTPTAPPTLVGENHPAALPDADLLRHQVETQQALLDKLLAFEKERQEIAELKIKVATLEQKLAALPDPVTAVQQQREKAASTILNRAERKYKEQNTPEAADYQNLLQLFPETTAARKAKTILSTLNTPGKGDVL